MKKFFNIKLKTKKAFDFVEGFSEPKILFMVVVKLF